MSEAVPAIRSRSAPAPASSRPRSYLALIAGSLAALPLVNVAFDIATGGLGVDPVEDLIRRSGWWALTLLVCTLAVTPVRRLTGWNPLIQIRRPIGVAAFCYALLHFTVYVTIDQWFALSYIIEDILERPFITAGFVALLLLAPLAATSTRDSIRRLGGKRWRRLHRLIYPAALLAVLHYYWLVKADTTKPLIYAGVVIGLLLLRLKIPAMGKPARERADA